MKRIYLFCDPRSLNEATIYYNDIVRRGLDASIGCKQFMVVHSLCDIKKPDYIYTMTHHFFVLAKLRFPKARTICWFQGVGYEEAKLNRPWWKQLLFKFDEWFTVKNADYILFVSEKMKDYYREHYGYKGNNYTIIPCYNLQQSELFTIKQYDTPSFAYAGGVSIWQSVDTILDVYAIIEKEIPKASLTLYCKTSPELHKMIDKRGIKNVEIKYVPLDSLQDELHKHKYGFILREKNWVNAVATPTKMNSYLASYMIPIFSDGVDDFVKNIKLGEFTLCAQTPLRPRLIADEIVKFEKEAHEFSNYKKIVDVVFDNHYNDAEYILSISKGINVTFLGK